MIARRDKLLDFIGILQWFMMFLEYAFNIYFTLLVN